MRKGLENIDTITPDIKEKLCSDKDSKAMTKLLSHGCCFVRGRMHDILEKEKICRNNIKEGRIYVSNQRKKRSGLPCTALYDGCVSSGTCHEG
jgi:hypothetical protein